MKKSHKMLPAYTQAFSDFLAHTNEKQVLYEVLSSRIARRGISTLLDIGAGNGDLAIPLSKTVQRYTAIEQKKDYADRLRAAQIDVIGAPFPCMFSAEYDCVLMSHSLPTYAEGVRGWEALIAAAWQHVNDTGRLFIITYEDEDSEWHELLRAAGLGESWPREGRVGRLKAYLREFGTVKCNVNRTHVRTNDLESMCRALAFVWSDGKADQLHDFMNNSRVRDYLNAHHAEGDGYSFPFQHYLLEVSR